MNIDFIGRRRMAFIFSLVLILVGIVVSVIKGGPTYGVDFTGGLLLQVAFKEKIGIDQLSKMRAIFKEKGLSGSIQRLGGNGNEVLIKIRLSGNNPDSIREDIEAILKNELGNFQEISQSDRIDPAISKEMKRGAYLAILFALLGILVYIAFRFEFRFAIAAIIALIHDVFITTFFLVATNIDFDITIIAALLTLAGYSVNDTIVLFDRIRENMKLLRKESLVGIINKSINQTLNRTIITSLTTILAVLSLYLFGGEVIRPFALTLLFGIIIGTYSSIFVASPILVYWPKRR